MGLDMYLKAERRFNSAELATGLTPLQRSRTRYFSGYDFSDDKDQKMYADVLALMGLEPKDVDAGTPTGYITVKEGGNADVMVTVGYWRKANQVHAWFVKEVQGGADECKPHEVTREKLQALADACQHILNLAAAERSHQAPLWPKLAEDTLAPQAGYFFGSTDLDEGYLADLKDTVAIVARCLSPKLAACTFTYQSSW